MFVGRKVQFVVKLQSTPHLNTASIRNKTALWVVTLRKVQLPLLLLIQ